MNTKLSVWTGVAAILALAVFAPPAQAQSVVGSPHDMSADLPVTQRVCVFCPTPHQPEGPPQVNTDPLWNHTLSATANYLVYASATLNAVPVDIGGGTTVSNLCMSCHDDTVGVGSLYNDPNEIPPALGEETPTNAATLISAISVNADMGTDLSNDHPINFTYDAALVTADAAGGPNGLADPTVAPVLPLLFAGTVQCASCHDPHNNTFGAFLVLSNVNSALCTTCHLK
jgi:predicted CXXCH cytochrome family protein